MRINPLSAKPHKMIKYTQTIHRLLPTNRLNVFDHFVGLALKLLRLSQIVSSTVYKQAVVQRCFIKKIFLKISKKS